MTYQLQTIASTGNSSNRVDIIFLGDGYTSSQIATTYQADIQNYLSYIFDDSALTQPFGRYQNFFNVYAIDVISNQSGADDPTAGVVRDTALDATYKLDGVTQRLLGVDVTKAATAMNDALAGTGIGAEMRYVLVNDTQYGGSGGYFGVYAAGNSSSRDIALHEIGHSFAGLADEYGGNAGTYAGSEPTQVNVTTNPTGAKWAEWLGYNDPILGVVGAYQGGFYYDQGVYRPTADSKMRDLGRPFDPIARQTFIHEFYKYVDPLDSFDNNVGTKFNLPTLGVHVIDPAVILVDWTVNGQSFVNAGQTFDFVAHGFGAGNYTISARAYDPTDWVRDDRSDLQQTISWTVVEQGPGRNDFNGDGHSDVLFIQPGGNFNSDYQWQMNDRAILGEAGVDLFDKAFSVQVSGDFNGDGKSDVLFENPATAGVWEWQLNGSVIAAQGAVDVGDPSFHILGTADVNGDGRSDLLWRNNAGLLYQWQMNGTSDAGAAVGSLDPSVWHAVGAGDFTGDGKADILFHYQNAGNAADPVNGAFDIWQMNGSAVTATIGVERPDASWQILGIGDFNGDAISDIAIRNVSATPDNGAVWIYLMKGTVTTHPDTSKTADIKAQGAAGIADAATWHVQTIGDLNGDGNDDILFRNDAGYFYSWNMNGTHIASEGLAGTQAGNWADPSLHVIGQHWDLV